MASLKRPSPKAMPKASPLRQVGASLLVGPKASPTSTPRSDTIGAKPVGSLDLKLSSAAAPAAVLSPTTASSASPLKAVGSRTVKTANTGVGAGLKAEPNPGAISGIACAPASEFTEEATLKFHSAVRWGKSWSDIEALVGDSMSAALAAKDPKNGNLALHIAAQNGHLEIVKKLLAAGASVNVQNGKGQTPLHMSVEYDFYFVSKVLLAANADPQLENNDGHKALLGIDGGKTGNEAWDNAVTILKAATTAEQIDTAFGILERATAETIDKAQLIQAGMMKKKNPATKEIWDHKRFMAVAAKL